MTSMPNKKGAAYSPVAKALHWGMAALLFVQFGIAYLMRSDFPLSAPFRMNAFHAHKSLGLLLLILLFVRLQWRATHKAPPMLPQMPDWEKRATRTNNIALYALVFVAALSGWALLAYSHFTSRFFGLFTIPDLPFMAAPMIQSLFTRDDVAEIHEIMATLLLLSIIAHTGAVLWHHVKKRDGVLLRMAPVRWHAALSKLRMQPRPGARPPAAS